MKYMYGRLILSELKRGARLWVGTKAVLVFPDGHPHPVIMPIVKELLELGLIQELQPKSGYVNWAKMYGPV